MAPDEFARLRPKMKGIVIGVHAGLTDKQIAVLVGTTPHTVKNYLREIYDIFGLWNRLELALWYEANIQHL